MSYAAVCPPQNPKSFESTIPRVYSNMAGMCFRGAVKGKDAAASPPGGNSLEHRACLPQGSAGEIQRRHNQSGGRYSMLVGRLY